MVPTAEALSEPSEIAAVRDRYSVTPRGERLWPGWARAGPGTFCSIGGPSKSCSPRTASPRAGFDLVCSWSVFGFASSSPQLWQDASAGFVPRPLRPLYCAAVQAAIGAIERWKPEPDSPNASVYLVLAKRV